MRLGRQRDARRGRILLAAVWLMAAGLAPTAAMAAAQAGSAPAGRLVKLVILSRHGVRSPIPSASELAGWTASPWPSWRCPAPDRPDRPCDPGQLTPRGRSLAAQMGAYYRAYLARLLPPEGCPSPQQVFVWADTDERTRETGLALLRGFRPNCDSGRYFRIAPAGRDRIFHPVGNAGPCRLDAARAERDIAARAGGDLSGVAKSLERELAIAQHTLQCCRPKLCRATARKCGVPPSEGACTLTDRLPSCLVRRPDAGGPTRVQLGGALRVASSFAELVLLEYANGLPRSEVGWGRILRSRMPALFRLHTAAFDLEQRTPYVAALQGSMLLRRILGALADAGGGRPGTAPPAARFVAYIGHDTNIANVAAMLDLAWRQPGYRKNQMPPAGALIFELRQSRAGERTVHVFYAAQSLDRMRALKGRRPVITPVPVPGCGRCSLAEFAELVDRKLDRDCSQ
jgi:4-phytase / acid phosphatase